MFTVLSIPGGFVVVDQFGIYEHDSIVHRTRASAQVEADQINSDAAAWNRGGISDASWMDAGLFE